MLGIDADPIEVFQTDWFDTWRPFRRWRTDSDFGGLFDSCEALTHLGHLVGQYAQNLSALPDGLLQFVNGREGSDQPVRE